MKTASEYADPLRQAIAHPEQVSAAIQKFLDDYWVIQDDEVADLTEWEILGELASGLEYYEEKSEWRTESCLLDEKQATQKIIAGLRALDAYQDSRTIHPTE